MRRHSLFLLPFLPLAACGAGGGGEASGGSDADRRHAGLARNLIGNQGSPSFRRPDGSFDRADYRRIMVPGCAAGFLEGNSRFPVEERVPLERVNRYCACAVELVLASNRDEKLFAMNRDSPLNRAEYAWATRACTPELSGREAVSSTPPGNAAGTFVAPANGSAPASR